MDLVQTVRKEGSRGGTGDFKWSDVQASTHREHYLGHSIMAPTGRWAKGKDLTWYAKGDQGSDQDAAAVSEADARKEEIRKIKEAEQDAMARALGLPVPDRSNPNNQELGTRREVQQVIKEAGGRDQPVSKGIGYERESAAGMANETPDPERIEGNVDQQDKELRYALNEYKRRHKSDRRESRSRSRDRHNDRKHRRHRSKDRERRRRSRSRDRERPNKSNSGPKGVHRGRDKRDRSRSPRRRDYRGDRHSSRRD
ncbi:uncharacterized protein HMPREF1541_04793 [Cyphellophora europaea CBS 101466]|uniref:Multiple myeloma tumor-associated protein 2-like N-terminal domain-containing protein n=1 Tax=Cyphellophora europaea (strain CBS 101466) TaxID=1220924 RepID=W2RVI1_CYPE1|nr:uncharacterized protein HMPREF1541_04793 [Cyphellophora europaea CBS 101466]ETN40516.1 hypothetical protein HMPREF1541_04793 [Cyphellophora europaea CBS 101466]